MKLHNINKHLKETEPAYKLATKGRGSLSTSELLSMLIVTGAKDIKLETAHRILTACNYNLNSLAKMSLEQLEGIEGVSLTSANVIVSALEIGRRRRAENRDDLPQVHSSQMAYEHMLPRLQDLDHEQFWCVYLNKKNRVIATIQISKGGMSETVVDGKIIFQNALKFRASSIIMAHNHPSGSPKPSQADHQITRKVSAGAQLLDMKVLDHIIIGDNAYYSFGDEGQMI